MLIQAERSKRNQKDDEQDQQSPQTLPLISRGTYEIIYFSSILFISTFATTVQPIHGKAMEDLDSAFPAKCYTQEKSLTCQFWARALKLELEELIVSLQYHGPADSEDLHSDMLLVDDSFLQSTALYFHKKLLE